MLCSPSIPLFMEEQEEEVMLLAFFTFSKGKALQVSLQPVGFPRTGGGTKGIFSSRLYGGGLQSFPKLFFPPGHQGQ